VNLIRYNEVAALPYKRPAAKDVAAFQEVLRHTASTRTSARAGARHRRRLRAVAPQARRDFWLRRFVSHRSFTRGTCGATMPKLYESPTPPEVVGRLVAARQLRELAQTLENRRGDGVGVVGKRAAAVVARSSAS